MLSNGINCNFSVDTSKLDVDDTTSYCPYRVWSNVIYVK
jgi:hypothetical protein